MLIRKREDIFYYSIEATNDLAIIEELERLRLGYYVNKS